MRGLVRLSSAHESAVLDYLAQAPYENVFLTWLICSDRSVGTRAAIYAYVKPDGTVEGVAFFGRQIVIAAHTQEALKAFAQTAPGYRFERMIVGPRPAIEDYWEMVRAWHAPARLTRESQPLLAIDRARLKGRAAGVRVRVAQPIEWGVVAQNSAEMIEHELGYDPRAAAADFNANIRSMIDRQLWWVGERRGKLVFFCNAGPSSSRTLQLQGIWTPPQFRNKGYATAALFGICEELLRHFPSLSLYVNGFNAPALALYDRLGFRRVGEFMTLLF